VRTKVPVLLASLAVVAGCSGGGSAVASDDRVPRTVKTPLPQGSEPVELDPADFTADIDHPYWPMAPGTRWTYREVEDGETLEVVVTATSATRRIANGITARVVRDSVTLDGELIEDTFDWYAQDSAGNVWYLGEDTKEFENGKAVSSSGSFEAGVDGAQAGVMLPARPEVGMRYRQEYYRGEAEDNGRILAVEHMADVPYGHLEDLLVTVDTNALEPKVLEYKMYAPGIGPVLALGISGGTGREELISVEQVGPDAGLTPLGKPDGAGQG
jgi:hypothetical protein